MDVAVRPDAPVPVLTALDRVQQRIASGWLASRAIPESLGTVRLAPHQREAAGRLMDIIDAHGGALLADVTGLGKTYTALAVARCHASFVVVAPAALRDMWRDAMGAAETSGRVISFEQLSRAPVADHATLVIVDEAHHARNTATRRYAALCQLTAGTRVLVMTATPLHNRAHELGAQLALFLGARAFRLSAEQYAPLVVRRNSQTRGGPRLPRVARPIMLPVDHAPEVFRAIAELPPAITAADGGSADALLRLGLIRAWTSSDAALRAALRRRLQRANALTHALQCGRFPTRRELAAWCVLDDAVQLAFPELMVAATTGPDDLARFSATVAEHAVGVRRVLEALDRGPHNDRRRAGLLRHIRREHSGERVVAFTQFAETARGLYGSLARDAGIALVTAAGARIASGRVSRQEIVRRFGASDSGPNDRRLPIDLLIATDVLSEGLNLQGASVLVHLDMPWTGARIEQRIGRLRRIGARHRRVAVYAVGAPARPRELRRIVRILQRKARLVRTVLGSDGVFDGSPVPARVRRDESGVISAAERLRDVLRSWLRTATDTSRQRVTASHPECAMTTVFGLGVPWRALVLCRSRGREALVAIDRESASTHPETLLRTALLVPSNPVEPGESLGGDAGRNVLTTAWPRAMQWLAECRGTTLTSAAIEARSRAHARALRRLAELQASVPRHDRMALASSLAAAHEAILQARGAGAEHRLAEWLAQDLSDRTAPLASRLTALIERLERVELAAAAGTSSEHDAVVAMLFLVSRETP